MKALADLGWEAALARDPGFARGLNVHAGDVTYAAVAQDLGLPFKAYTPRAA